jgi:N-methylhydantoinase B
MKETGALATIQRQIQWNRLIAVVEEQAQTMIRTAFSTTVREAGDLSAGVFDLQGRNRSATSWRNFLPPA